MKNFLNKTVGVLGAIGFIWAALAIFTWDIAQLRKARASRDWPQAIGTIEEASVDTSDEHAARVVYAYTVAGKSYTSRQISFDLFDKPGGQGRTETVVARYPTGKNVRVFYDPGHPVVAILEPEVYDPFFMPLLFGTLFLLGALLIIWMTVRQVVKGRPASPGTITSQRRIAATAIISLVMFAGITLICFESAIRETHLKAFGERPLGMPNLVFVLVLQTLLYLPMPWIFWHLMHLTFQALQDKRRIGIGYILTAGNTHPHLRRSQRVCIAGLVYLLAICGAWIFYAATRGI